MKFLMILSLVIFFSVFSISQYEVFSEHILYEGWVWQKGIDTIVQGDTDATMTFTMPTGQINSNSILLNYIEIFTDKLNYQELRNGGGFIQAGFIYPNEKQIRVEYPGGTFFYSDGITPFLVNHPYNAGAQYTISIFFRDSWWIYITDDVSKKETFVNADWASGKLVRAGMVLENLGQSIFYLQNNSPNTLTKIEDFGTLSNINDQRLFVGNDANLRTPYSVTEGWYENIEQKVIDVHMIIHHIPPPNAVLFENNAGVYTVGFKQIQLDENKIPEWVKNILLWYEQRQISEDEFIDAIEFLINKGIIEIKS